MPLIFPSFGMYFCWYYNRNGRTLLPRRALMVKALWVPHAKVRVYIFITNLSYIFKTVTVFFCASSYSSLVHLYVCFRGGHFCTLLPRIWFFRGFNGDSADETSSGLGSGECCLKYICFSLWFCVLALLCYARMYSFLKKCRLHLRFHLYFAEVTSNTGF